MKLICPFFIDNNELKDFTPQEVFALGYDTQIFYSNVTKLLTEELIEVEGGPCLSGNEERFRKMADYLRITIEINPLIGANEEWFSYTLKNSYFIKND